MTTAPARNCVCTVATVQNSTSLKGKTREVLGSETSYAHTTGAGQRALYPFLHLIGEVLHCNTPPQLHPGPSPKKECERERGEKVFSLGFGAADSKKTKTNTSVDEEFSPIMGLAFPSFHSTPNQWKPIIPSRGFPHLAQKCFGYYGRYYGTVYTVPCQGNQDLHQDKTRQDQTRTRQDKTQDNAKGSG